MDNWFPTNPAPRWGIGSPFKTWMARLFGKRLEGTDGRTTVIGYQWRGRVYIVAESSDI